MDVGLLDGVVVAAVKGKSLPCDGATWQEAGLPARTLALAGCNRGNDEAEAIATEVPSAVAAQGAGGAVVESEYGTPVKERVATLGLLNKRNNLTQDLVLKPGESRRVGNVIVKLATCERTLPWENPPETGAFVQVFVEERADAGHVDLVVARHLHLGPQFAQVLDEVEGEAVVVVDHQQHIARNSLFHLWFHDTSSYGYPHAYPQFRSLPHSRAAVVCCECHRIVQAIGVLHEVCP